ncbi:MAG: signal transduction protein [Herbaspirillum sp.]|nr:signal transduction protein [Herbaspirillum sp.]
MRFTMTSTEDLPPRGRRMLAEWLFLLSTLLALAGSIAYFQYGQYQQITAREQEHLTSQAGLVEKNLLPQLLLANRVIDNIVHDLPSWQAENDGFKRGNHQLQVINDSLIGIRPILIIKADGTVISSSEKTLIGMNFIQRKYFQTALQNPDPAILHVSPPFLTVLDSFVISLFKTIPGPNGTFGGIVIVSLVPEYFSTLLDSVLYAQDMRSSLAHGEGIVFVTSPLSAKIHGVNLNQPGTFFKRHKDAGQSTNLYNGIVRASGDDRMLVLHTIKLTSPLMDNTLEVALSRDIAVLYAPLRESIYQQSSALLILSICSILGLLFIQRRRRDLSIERKIAKEKIRNLAFFDQLTGLPNRTLLLDRLQQAMVTSNRSGNYGGLLFIDLDNFKTLNDTLGHDTGDMLLKQVSLRLKGCVREYDTVARLGGDEFVIILAQLMTASGDVAARIGKISEKIRAALGQPYRLGEIPYYSTASIGATAFLGALVSNDSLMKQADLAMYKAKEAGRNAWRFFDPTMEQALKELTALEDDLRRAVDEKQLVLHYQAQIVGELRVAGAEVLVRWQHPERGMVMPGEFIALAEKTGLILPLGHWVLQTACTQLALWASQPEMSYLTLAVNVSAHQFRQPDFVEQVLAVLKSTGANPRRLKLELTESMLVHNVQEIIEKMSALKVKGVSFSLDDFGTGYSSLSYLKRLPLDQLKIDQSFVRDILIDTNDAAIAKLVIVLAESMGLMVIAEGVEIESQRDLLARMGCHAYQGYLFSRPVPLEAFEALIKERLTAVDLRIA